MTCRKFIHPMFFIYSSKVWSATPPVLTVGNKQNTEHAKLNIQSNVYKLSDHGPNLSIWRQAAAGELYIL